MQPDVFPRVFEVVQELKEVAVKYGKTPGQTGLRWRVLRWLLDQEVSRRLVWAVPNLSKLTSWPLSERLEPWDTLWGWHTKNP